MIKHVWSVLCSQSVTDAQTNNVSLFNVVEQITATAAVKELPEGAVHFVQLPLELMSLWEKSSDDGDSVGTAVVDIVDASDKRLGGSEMSVDLSGHRRCRSRLVLGGIPLTGSGRYAVRISLRVGEEEAHSVAELPLEVTLQYSADSTPPVDTPEVEHEPAAGNARK